MADSRGERALKMAHCYERSLQTQKAIAAYKNAMTAAGWFRSGREAMIGLDQKTAQVHLIFSVLLSAGLAIAAIF